MTGAAGAAGIHDIVKPVRPENDPPPDDADTGLPLLRTWRGVYTFVLAAFVLTAALLTALTLAYP